eukprot:418529-Pleurochrysis_carterae.AAC.1
MDAGSSNVACEANGRSFAGGGGGGGGGGNDNFGCRNGCVQREPGAGCAVQDQGCAVNDQGYACGRGARVALNMGDRACDTGHAGIAHANAAGGVGYGAGGVGEAGAGMGCYGGGEPGRLACVHGCPPFQQGCGAGMGGGHGGGYCGGVGPRGAANLGGCGA